MSFLWFGREPELTLMLKVVLTDGQEFEAPVEGWHGKVFLGTNFVRVELGNDECVLYPMYRVREARYYRQEDKK